MNVNLDIAEPDDLPVAVSLAEADHRIANHLAVLSSYVRLKGSALVRRKKAPDAKEVGLLILAIGVQIDAISDLHRLLSGQGGGNTTDLGAVLSRVCRGLKSAVSGDVVIIELFGTGCQLPLCDILPVAQICTEVITNAIKYGHKPGAGSVIRVSCGQTAAGDILIQVSDNGPGLCEKPPEPVSGGVGFRMIEALVSQINGRIEHHSTAQGLTVRLALPAVRVQQRDRAPT
jgi:two-component sensor histidine kinase